MGLVAGEMKSRAAAVDVGAWLKQREGRGVCQEPNTRWKHDRGDHCHDHRGRSGVLVFQGGPDMDQRAVNLRLLFLHAGEGMFLSLDQGEVGAESCDVLLQRLKSLGFTILPLPMKLGFYFL